MTSGGVDSHQHFWRYSPATHPWIDERMGQAGLLEVESERVSIGPPLRGAVEERREEARRQGIEIDAEIPDGLPALRGESQALQRIFGTLIDAALRRSASGQEITVRADSDDEQVWVRVSASGTSAAAKPIAITTNKVDPAGSATFSNSGPTPLKPQDSTR